MQLIDDVLHHDTIIYFSLNRPSFASLSLFCCSLTDWLLSCKGIPGVFDQTDSMAMYDAITGRDLTMNYHDVLGKKEDQPVTDCRMDTHDHLEAQFGL